MAVKANTTTTAQMANVNPRAIDFVTRFSRNWDALREVYGIVRPIRKQPGTKLEAYNATVTLQPTVAEGDEIPYSLAKVEPVAFEDLTIEKYAKGISIESVAKYGARIAVQKTDDAFLNELQGKVMDTFYAFLQTGTLTDTASTFQMGLAMAVGNVRDKFKKMHLTATEVVAWVNTLDAYKYLGAAELSVQTLFGMDYIENFLGARRVFLSSEIPAGKIIATPVENIDLYYIDPSDSDFAQLGLEYVVDGVTPLIGFHTEGNYSHAVGDSFAIMGMKLWAEYLDGIAVITVE